VKLVVSMEILETQQELAQYDADVVLRDETWLHEICTAPARAELHDDPQVGALEERAVVLGHKGRIQLREDGYLGYDVVHLVLRVLDIDYLDGDRLSGLSIQPSNGQCFSTASRDSYPTLCRPCQNCRHLSQSAPHPDFRVSRHTNAVLLRVQHLGVHGALRSVGHERESRHASVLVIRLQRLFEVEPAVEVSPQGAREQRWVECSVASLAEEDLDGLGTMRSKGATRGDGELPFSERVALRAGAYGGLILGFWDQGWWLPWNDARQLSRVNIEVPRRSKMVDSWLSVQAGHGFAREDCRRIEGVSVMSGGEHRAANRQ
jgi:hypothetical protein